MLRPGTKCFASGSSIVAGGKGKAQEQELMCGSGEVRVNSAEAGIFVDKGKRS